MERETAPYACCLYSWNYLPWDCVIRSLSHLLTWCYNTVIKTFLGWNWRVLIIQASQQNHWRMCHCIGTPLLFLPTSTSHWWKENSHSLLPFLESKHGAFNLLHSQLQSLNICKKMTYWGTYITRSTWDTEQRSVQLHETWVAEFTRLWTLELWNWKFSWDCTDAGT